MVETRRSSAAKHSSPSPFSSSDPPPKRLKAEAPASPTASAPGGPRRIRRPRGSPARRRTQRRRKIKEGIS